MRKGHRGIWGCVAIVAGLVIIFSLVLPGEFWWFIFAAALIGLGIWVMRCRKQELYLYEMGVKEYENFYF